MRKTDSQKGITLVALIITIIVLLILAIVAIVAVTNDGIINHAQNARDRYENAKDDENEILESYLNKINSSMGNSAVTNPDDSAGDDTTGDDTTGGNEIITFKVVGVSYTAREGMTWKQWIDSEEFESGNISYGDRYVYTKPEHIVYYEDDGNWIWPWFDDPIMAGIEYENEYYHSN